MQCLCAQRGAGVLLNMPSKLLATFESGLNERSVTAQARGKRYIYRMTARRGAPDPLDRFYRAHAHYSDIDGAALADALAAYVGAPAERKGPFLPVLAASDGGRRAGPNVLCSNASEASPNGRRLRRYARLPRVREQRARPGDHGREGHGPDDSKSGCG